MTCVQEADGSAAYLVNLLADEFSCFRDIYNVDDEEIKIYKRAQILVADLWACFEGKGYGKFDDIDQITMFAGMTDHMKIPDYPRVCVFNQD